MPETLLNLQNNPVRRARLKMGLSLTAIAEAAKINYQTWYSTECGCYADIPPGILGFLEAEGFNVLHLETEYHDFVSETRDEFYLTHLDALNKFTLSGEAHPVEEFRTALGLSRAALAKQLCVQPAVLYKVESGDSKGLPRQLRDALLEAGVSEVLIGELEEGVKSWAQ